MYNILISLDQEVMFTIKEGSALSVEIITKAIEFNERRKEAYDRLENYYKGDHDILFRKKAPANKNNKLIINHAKYITDINTGYLMGNPVDYQVTEGKNMKNVLEEYSKQVISDLDSEVAKDLSIFGRQYELVYVDEDNNVKSAGIDVRNAICIYDDTVEHRKMFGIIYQKKDNGEGYEYVKVYDVKNEYDCHVGNKISIGKERPHTFGAVPLIEYRNNSEYMGDFEQVISLIDAYNILQSDRVNDKEQLVEAILVGYGIHLEDGQMGELIANKSIFDLPPKGEAELAYLTKNLDEAQVDILRKTIENDIHKISQTPNMSDENFAGNSSGVAIRYKLLAFEQSVKNKERFFIKGLLERFELYKNYLTSISKPVNAEVTDVRVVFKRNLPQNDLEIAQMIHLISPIIDDETLAGQLSFVENAKKSIELNRKEEMQKYSSESPSFGFKKLTPNEEE